MKKLAGAVCLILIVVAVIVVCVKLIWILIYQKQLY